MAMWRQHRSEKRARKEEKSGNVGTGKWIMEWINIICKMIMK